MGTNILAFSRSHGTRLDMNYKILLSFTNACEDFLLYTMRQSVKIIIKEKRRRKPKSLFGCFNTPTQGEKHWVELDTRRHGYGGTCKPFLSEYFCLFLGSGRSGFFRSSRQRTSAMHVNDLAFPE
jgi:hypothetical protein